MFDFGSKLQEGASLHNLAEQNKKEINDVYIELGKSISDFIGCDVEFWEKREYTKSSYNHARYIANTLALINANASKSSESEETGYILVTLRSTKEPSKRSESLFRTKESDSGYPVYIDHSSVEVACFSQAELVEALKHIVGSVDFHKKIQIFRNN